MSRRPGFHLRNFTWYKLYTHILSPGRLEVNLSRRPRIDILGVVQFVMSKVPPHKVEEEGWTQVAAICTHVRFSRHSGKAKRSRERFKTADTSETTDTFDEVQFVPLAPERL